eukprot:Lankesteria_metandrocarpae@DN157_c0_g1_i1.p1
MSSENITFVGFGRIRDQLILASVFDRRSAQEKNEIDNAFRKFLLDGISRFSPGSRDKRAFSEGTIFMVADMELACIYAVAVRSKSYPDRIAYACLAEVIRLVGSSEEGKSLHTAERAGAFTRVYRKDLKDIMDKYDNPQSVDKAAEVTGKVDNVKGIMQDNINKVIANHANIQELEQKTDNLNTNAQEFNRVAADVSRVMWWQKMKVTVLLILVGAAILAYIAVMVVKFVQ